MSLQAAPSIRAFIKDPYVLEFLGLPEDPADYLAPSSIPQRLRHSPTINNPQSSIVNPLFPYGRTLLPTEAELIAELERERSVIEQKQNGGNP